MNLRGKYGEAIIFTDRVDNKAISQIITSLNQPWAENSHMRIMPDCHAGAGNATIGMTFHVQNAIPPATVGVDLGCGIRGCNFGKQDFNKEDLERFTKQNIPFGFEVNETAVHDFGSSIDQLKCRKLIPDKMHFYYRGLGTVGGGNHFIEHSFDSDGNLWSFVHSGSRNLGLQIAKAYQKIAEEEFQKNSEQHADLVQETIKKLKAEGREDEIETALARLKEQKVQQPKALKDLATLSGQNLKDYLLDIEIAQEYAALNRYLILKKIAVGFFGMSEREYEKCQNIDTIHNYIDVENSIVRKGAVSAQEGEMLVIPLNMRDGILLCRGKGNPEWNCSAPHGAGRLYSRSQCKEIFSMEEYEEEMKGICSTSVCRSTLDEAPMAYKPAEEIKEQILDTVEIIEQIRPIINVKAS